MKAEILDGSPVADKAGARIRAALEAELLARGWDVEPVVLNECRIGACAGDFLCWVRSPGVCNVDDDNRRVAAELATSDLAIYLTPVTFGGNASTLKRMVDRQIQNVLPFFATVAGETHHQPRYDHNPDLLVVGWADTPDGDAEAIFRHLAWRNAINFHARRFAAEVVPVAASDHQLVTSAAGWLDELERGVPPPIEGLPSAAATVSAPMEVGRAVLLVGSPKTRNSTSNSLGGYLYDQLAERGIEVETVYLHTVVRSPSRMRELLDAVEAADLVTLAFPLYVDSLPAPVIEILERIAAERRGRVHRQQLFAAVANCGFPEAAQTATSVAICRTFAQEAGFAWAGSVSLGGGAAVDGQPLASGKTARTRRSLDLAAGALAQGQAIPEAARDLMAQPMIPNWAYRWMGTFGWKRLAARYGVRKQQRSRPYAGGAAAQAPKAA